MSRCRARTETLLAWPSDGANALRESGRVETLVLSLVLPPFMTARPPYSHSPFAASAPFAVPVGMGAPAPGRLSRLGYVAAWALLGIAGIAGLCFSLYRNDVLLTAARQGGWEPRYLAMEARLLGTPGWGTPRSLSFELQAATPDPATGTGAVLAPESGDGAAGVRAALPVAAPEPSPSVAPPASPAAASPARAASTPTPSTPSTARATSDGVAIVSLDALATEKRAKPAAVAAAPAAPAARPAPVRAAERSAAAPVAKAQPAVAAKAPVAKAPPSPARPAPPPPANDSPLKAAIRSAIVKESGGK